MSALAAERGADPKVSGLEVRAYEIPTDCPESDGTLEWDSTTVVVVEVAAGEERGLGYCNITKCCTEVCPEQIKITDNGIIPMKERVVDVKYDPIRFFRRKPKAGTR